MLVLERDGSLAEEMITVSMPTEHSIIVDVPAEVALQEEMFIDRLIDLTFTFLGLSNIEIRIHEP